MPKSGLARVREAIRVASPQVFRGVVLVATTAYILLDLRPVRFGPEEWTLFAAIALISLLDIGLAHGDTADVDTAFLVAGLYLYGTSTVLLMLTLTRVLVHLLVRHGGGFAGLMDALVKRYVAVLGSIPLLGYFQAHSSGKLWEELVQVALVGTVFVVLQLLAAQVGRAKDRRDSVPRLFLGNLALQGPLVAAAVSVSILLVITVEDMGAWAVVLTLLLLMTIRQSFAQLIEIRASYHATVEALIGAMEAQHPGGRGGGEQVAALARSTAAELGWFGARVERVGYAALLRYFGLSLAPQEREDSGQPSSPLSEVAFLRPVAPMVSPLERGVLPGMRRRDLLAAYVALRSMQEVSQGTDAHVSDELEASIGTREVRRVDEALQRAREKA